jgi:3-hydroxyacyl-CoA dehydrogenase/enoyl-CoA hydratase/3-hydroxybutyryl-CoA epimerase
MDEVVNTGAWRLVRDEEGLAWLHLDSPGRGANVLSADVLLELAGRLQELEQHPPRGLVILSDKPTGFIAGADIREFTELKDQDGAYAAIRRGQEVFDRLAALPFPTAALVHGFCVGGGLELALACRYRVARDDKGTRLGLPEVRLGIHPGFGGSVRAIQLLGPIKAMDLMLTGRTLDGRSARRLGLVDECVPERHLLRAARRLILTEPSPRRPKRWEQWLNHDLVRPWLARFLERRVAVKARRDHYPAPYALIELWRDHGGRPTQMLPAEAESVARLIVGPTAQNLVRVFLLQDELKALGKEHDFRAQHVHVVGAGVMGGDIAAWCALRGCRVTLQDQGPERIAPAIKRAQGLFKKRLKRPRPIQEAMDRLIPDVEGVGVSRADVVIEAIFEDLEAKRTLYRSLEPRLAPGALLCTNTSSIPLEELAEGLERPERLVGLHFFNPVAQMQLVEIVQSQATDTDLAKDAMAFTRQIDRLPLPVTSTPGFLVNRILMPYLLEAVTLEAEGVPAMAIDRAAVDFGMPMGPIELADRVGLDVCLHVAGILGEHMGTEVPPRLQGLVEQGRLGQKSGRGFYDYRKGRPIKRTRGKDASLPDDVQDRLVLRMLNESLACLRESVVSSADLLDAGMVYGTGFAPFRGGPVHYVGTAGAAELKQRLLGLAARHGPRFEPDAYWDQLSTLNP